MKNLHIVILRIELKNEWRYIHMISNIYGDRLDSLVSLKVIFTLSKPDTMCDHAFNDIYPRNDDTHIQTCRIKRICVIPVS